MKRPPPSKEGEGGYAVLPERAMRKKRAAVLKSPELNLPKKYAQATQFSTDLALTLARRRFVEWAGVHSLLSTGGRACCLLRCLAGKRLDDGSCRICFRIIGITCNWESRGRTFR